MIFPSFADFKKASKQKFIYKLSSDDKIYHNGKIYHH